MTAVVVTTTGPGGWWWGGTGVLVPGGVSLSSGAFVPGQAFAVHLAPSGRLLAHFEGGTHDFDGVAVTCGFADVPLLAQVPGRLYCHVSRVQLGDAVQVYGIPELTSVAA